ncbi:MAG: hypothetical protein DI536_06955 [Archangium gephyra]|uniref:LptD C-terminal domain-containing protein n=1 Tax=Archangium gephyra TaxID=48 RepID=A0A2W5VZ74_9BACT|nr:MAG: hypothetical protein DI536_06955 [Archangium gephyra]
MLALWLALTICAAPASGDTELTAERLLHDGKRDLTTAEGRARLVSGGSIINAERIVYDEHKRIATAVGHVVVRNVDNGKLAVIADLVTVLLDDNKEVREIYLYDGQAQSKKDVSDEAFLAADTAEKLEKTGNIQALLQGNHLVREPNGWRVEYLELVPCECDYKNPSWSISSTEAVVDTKNDRVAVTNPVVKLWSVPVLWLPWLSLPLNDRQSGLLFPKPATAPVTGFGLELPVYLTLGRSADITLTPGFFLGGTQDNGLAGPKLSTEFRYAPSKRVTGKAILGLVYDFRTPRAVEQELARLRGSGHRGMRGEFAWQHVQDFDFGFGARADVNVHSDGDYNRDLTVDVLLSSTTYLRSGAKVFHRGRDHYLGLDVGLRQDIQWGYDLLGRRAELTLPYNAALFGPGTLQRLPAFTFGWLPPVLGPLRFEVEGEVVRLSPLYSKTGDEGVNAAGGMILPTPFLDGINRLYAPRGVVGTGDRIWQVGEREARTRLMALPKISVTAQPFGVFSASAFAAWRQFVWAGEASGNTWHRGYLLLGGRLETEVSRRFGRVRHVIQPLVEVRAVPFGAESYDAIVPYDAVDAAVPGISARVQGIAELRQRLMDGSNELLRVDVGQGLEFSGPRMEPTPGEFYGRVGSRIGWFSALGVLRFDPLANRVAYDGLTPVQPGRFTRASGRADVDDGRGHGAYFSYENVLMEGTMRSRQPIDLLFLVDRGFTTATRVQMITAGARWSFGPLSLRYDATLLQEQPNTTSTTPSDGRWVFQQHMVGVGFAPACDCWRVDVYAVQPLYPTIQPPQFIGGVTVSRFGTIGTR